MDFKTKTVLCIARLYSSSACVFWLVQPPTERTQLNDGYWCRNKLEVVFSCRVPCLWAWSSIPRTPLPPRAGSCCCASRVPAVGMAGRRSQLEAPPWSSCCSSRNSRALQNNGKSSRAVNCLQGDVLPAEALQSCSRMWCLGEPWPAAPGVSGQCQGRTTARCCPHTTQRMHQGSPGQNTGGFTPKATYQGHCTADLCSC